ncbi:MAG: PQQ-binding-like beta-propeller repeat protein [Micromonosporaceae bacterium]
MTAALRPRGAAFAVAAIAAALAVAIAGCSPAAKDDPAGSAKDKDPVAQTFQSAQAVPHHTTTPTVMRTLAAGFHLLRARGAGHLAPGSNPRALPADVLIADEDNNRLLLVDPQGRIRWRFPSRGDLHRGQSFPLPDDAFISPNGATIIATQEQDNTVSLINIASGHIVRRYGHPGVPGSALGYFSHPDDAMMLPRGDLLIPDIINCRILLLSPGRLHLIHRFGTTRACGHAPPAEFGQPNGAFPLRDGRFLVTEIIGDWVDEMSLSGRVYWSAHPPAVSYPSDANQIGRGQYVVADYSYPGQIVIFDRRGRTLWRFRPTGARALNHPSLALPLPNGKILVNDDYNNRVIVVDPKTKRIVWQYGHTGVAGSGAGYLNNPDGVDLAPPQSLLMTHAATMKAP